MASGGKYYRFDGLSILVVDDNRFVRSIMMTVFKGLGVGKMIQAENGEEAMAVLEVSAQMDGAGKDIDIIFADHLMEPKDGIELLRWVRAHDSDKIRFLPFVMMSGDADEAAVRLARDSGVTEYLAKPMSVMNVASRLLAIIDKPRAFVRAPNYFGPDRRRQTLPYDGEEKRRLGPEDVRVVEDGAHMVIDSQNGIGENPEKSAPPSGAALEESDEIAQQRMQA
ncbi:MULTISPECIES: response regulator [unclassified Azospirillum]|jgi:CheY-like chemotaxis protein|uniref:response regulator n=1 Tax=unclassified Azospirillum TaxID=2630922 RepID=UPI000B62B9F2|nr:MULTISPECIES: response regulator [unclassified Azospirillum]SNS16139.1 CheY chemotaxis protein or a CheY-like REC (receiver) domain [Azospirillum sp. RU38E]SNS33416.1 CheY chemotaxis protein or a CheY-like REC (receiver) domain [Azospirillum sp. RU37A]